MLVLEVVPHVELVQTTRETALRSMVMEREMQHVVDEVTAVEPGADGPPARRPEHEREEPEEGGAERDRNDGRQHQAIGSLGWSWWTPWIIQWRRAPSPLSGSKWKTVRCVQYSHRVQNTQPDANAISEATSGMCGSTTTAIVTIAGPKISSGTMRCTRVR